MSSVIHNGKVLDVHYTKHMNGYKFYIGDIYMGLVLKNSAHNWNAINYYIERLNNLEGFHHVQGFGSRHLASAYLLRVNSLGGYGRDDEERRDMIKRFKERENE